MTHKLTIGLTTSPRRQPTIFKTLDSLNKSGWEKVHIFAEPESPLPNSSILSRRKNQYGAWANWFYGLKELYETYDQPLYGMWQDDVVICRNTAAYIESLCEWPSDVCCFSLFTPQMYVGSAKWNRINEGSRLWMAQCLFFPKGVVKEILDSYEVWRFSGKHGIDNRVGLFAKYTNRAVYFHSPSLCQHIGETSTIWPNIGVDNDRSASNFVGEDFDALSFIQKQ